MNNGDLISRSVLLEAFGEEPLVWDSRDREDVQMHNDWLDYTKLVKEAPAVDVGPKWTSTAERLPVEEAIQYIRQHDELPEYLVCIEGGAVPTTLYFTGNGWVDDDAIHYRVTHWMPLPELPKEG